MKNQALFSSKDKSKKLKCRLLQFLFGALRNKSQTRQKWIIISVIRQAITLPKLLQICKLVCIVQLYKRA